MLTIQSANAPTTLAPFVTFTVYAVIATVKKDEMLLSAKAFASLSLISLLTSPLLTFCQALPTFFQAVSCFDRIEGYMLKEPASIPPSQLLPSLSSSRDITELQDFQSTRMGDTILFSFEHADIAWSPDASGLVLRKFSLNIHPGFTAITGPVGSGKSTLLETMIGETTLRGGSVMPNAVFRIAFCPQTPWIVNDTIRQNITGGLSFDQKRYDHSLFCCALQEDLARMPRGDLSTTGSNGSSLSRGQRQRVVSSPPIEFVNIKVNLSSLSLYRLLLVLFILGFQS